MNVVFTLYQLHENCLWKLTFEPLLHKLTWLLNPGKNMSFLILEDVPWQKHIFQNFRCIQNYRGSLGYSKRVKMKNDRDYLIKIPNFGTWFVRKDEWHLWLTIRNFFLKRLFIFTVEGILLWRSLNNREIKEIFKLRITSFYCLKKIILNLPIKSWIFNWFAWQLFSFEVTSF